MTTASASGNASPSATDATTRFVRIDGADIAYREVGAGEQLPLVALIHLGGNLDAWDPEVIDPLAIDRRVILLGYRGVGSSTGRVRDAFDDMAGDAIAAIHALGLPHIDLFGLSMGGMVAQAIVDQDPGLVRRVVLAGTGPQGGSGLTRMTGVMLRGISKSIATARPATSILFFTRSVDGRTAATDYRARLKRRHAYRDRAVAPGLLRAQLRAVARWGAQPRPSTASTFHPVLTFHGDDDTLVPADNAQQLRAVFPRIEIVTFTDAGHGVVSQERAAVTDRIRAFLRD